MSRNVGNIPEESRSQVHSLFQSDFTTQCDPAFIFQFTVPSSCLRLLPSIPLTSVLPLITCFRRQFPRKVWPIQLAFLIVLCSIFSPPWLPVTLHHFSHDRSNWSSPSFYSTTFQKLSRYFWSTFQIFEFFIIIQSCSPNVAPWQSLPYNWVQFAGVFAMAILDLNPSARLHQLDALKLLYCTSIKSAISKMRKEKKETPGRDPYLSTQYRCWRVNRVEIRVFGFRNC